MNTNVCSLLKDLRRVLLHSDSGRGSGGKENGKERQADAWQAGADSSKTVPVVAINAGKVSGKVKTILDHEVRHIVG
jgi:hypothetical protein